MRFPSGPLGDDPIANDTREHVLTRYTFDACISLDSWFGGYGLQWLLTQGVDLHKR